MDQLTRQACVTLVIDDPVARQCYPLVVPGSTEQEGHAFLRSLDNGVDAAVLRNARYLKAGGAILMVAGMLGTRRRMGARQEQGPPAVGQRQD